MDKMILPAQMEYTESYIPPHCRRPRMRTVNKEITVRIPCVKQAEAPIAFRHSECGFRKIVEYRLWDGRLFWRAYKYHKNHWLEYSLEDLKTKFTKWAYIYAGDTEEEARENIEHAAHRFLVLNNEEVWVEIGEPRCEIITFGLGHNHAETGLFIAQSYNENIAAERYFNALQRGEAVKTALEIAMARGDTNSIEGIKNSRSIEVMIPEAVHCNPAVEAGTGNPIFKEVENIIRSSPDSYTAGMIIMAKTEERV